MSTNSIVPSGFTPKGFWERKEGKTGMLFLALLIPALLYGGVVVLPFVITALENTILTVVLGAVLVAILFTLWEGRTLIRNAFQSFMRFLTGVFITIDPIGILQNNLDEMRSTRSKLDRAIEGVAGAKKNLEMAIDQKNVAIRKNLSLAAECDRQLAAPNLDQLKRSSILLTKQSKLQDAGMKQSNLGNLQRILNTTNQMYAQLQRWGQLSDYQVAVTENQVQEAKEMRRSVEAGYKGMNLARRMLQGDPEQMKQVNQVLEFLAEDNANKLGAMEDFSRYSEKFLSSMDIEQGAASADAEKMLAQFEQKLLQAGSSPTTPGAVVTDAEYVDVPKSKSSSYDSLIS